MKQEVVLRQRCSCRGTLIYAPHQFQFFLGDARILFGQLQTSSRSCLFLFWPLHFSPYSLPISLPFSSRGGSGRTSCLPTRLVSKQPTLSKLSQPMQIPLLCWPPSKIVSNSQYRNDIDNLHSRASSIADTQTYFLHYDEARRS